MEGRVESGLEIAVAERPDEDHEALCAVKRFQAGDRDAFALLYTRYFDRVYSYLRLVLRNRHEAEDAAQQVFLKALDALPRYEFRGPPVRSWLFAIVRNQALYELRRLGRVELVDPEEMRRRQEQAGEVAPPSEALTWLSDSELVIYVSRLPLAQRQVLMLRFMLDLSTEEAGRVLNRNANDVRQLQHRAIEYLRARLGAIRLADDTAERPADPIRRAHRFAPVLRERRFALK